MRHLQQGKSPVVSENVCVAGDTSISAFKVQLHDRQDIDSDVA